MKKKWWMLLISNFFFKSLRCRNLQAKIDSVDPTSEILSPKPT